MTCHFDEKHILKLFSLSFCQYVSTIPEKQLKRVCTERMMDHQYRENGARNIYSNYNQMGAYVKCSQKNYALSTFPSSNRRKFDESGKVLVVYVSEFTRV